MFSSFVMIPRFLKSDSYVFELGHHLLNIAYSNCWFAILDPFWEAIRQRRNNAVIENSTSIFKTIDTICFMCDTAETNRKLFKYWHRKTRVYSGQKNPDNLSQKSFFTYFDTFYVLTFFFSIITMTYFPFEFSQKFREMQQFIFILKLNFTYFMKKKSIYFLRLLIHFIH